jgi:hypothetical protein
MGAHPARSRGVGDNGESATSAIGLARWLHLAATPTFAIMALLTAVNGRTMESLCSSEHGGPLSGMVTMYILMTVFHSRPWLNLIAGKLV